MPSKVLVAILVLSGPLAAWGQKAPPPLHLKVEVVSGNLPPGTQGYVSAFCFND
jgi:hypothetical protein